MAESFKNKAMNRLQKFKAIRRKDTVEDSSSAKFYVDAGNPELSDKPVTPLAAAIKKVTTPPGIGNDAHHSKHVDAKCGVNYDHKPTQCGNKLAPVSTNVTGANESVNPDVGFVKLTVAKIDSTITQNGDATNRLKTSTTTTKTRSHSSVTVTRDPSYELSLTSHDLSGRASLSARDLVFGIPPPPVRPPRSSTTSLSVKIPMQKASSTPEIGPKDDAMNSPTTRDVLRVMDTSIEASDDEGRESESEDSYLAWSDGDDKSISSANSLSPTSDNIYENMNIRESQILNKAHRVAIEIMTTEDTYVQRLEILDKARRNTEVLLGNDIARQMFPNINSIFLLHKENMLPHLKERLSSWESKQQIGDIMKMFTPYLKMYTEYVKHFDGALDLVAAWNAKHVEFSKMLRSLTPKGASLNLKLQIKAHMLEPVQRVPRYQLLLQQYLKLIDADSREHTDIQVALDSVTQAAQHFEDMMKHGTLIGELQEIQRLVECPISLISSTRHLVKQGKIAKVNATTGKTVDRYIFLFNDLFLLCCEYTWLPFYAYKYKVRQMMDVDGMQIVEGDNLDVPFTFYIKTRKKTVELSAGCDDGLRDWTQALEKVIGDRMRNRLSKDTAVNKRRTMMVNPDNKLGKEAPTWINNSHVTMCMLCASSFSLLKKKHHCRACGVVACYSCSSHKADLEYDDFRAHRVCDECFLLLQESKQPIKQHSTFQPTSRERCVQRGYLQVSPDFGYSWRRRWFEFHDDHQLYCYKAQQDISPLMHTHLSQCAIDVCDMAEFGHKIIRVRIGKQTSSKTYLLRAEKKEQLPGWIDAFRTLAVRPDS